MFRWPPLIMHNANVVFMGLELFLNGMRFVAYHVVFVLLFGCAYVVFAWYTLPTPSHASPPLF